MAGKRCAIYDKIDALDEARTVADLVARMKPILNELAYYAVTGDGAVMEAHEEWHTQFTDRLYEATGAAAQGRVAPPPPVPAAKPRAPGRRPKTGEREFPSGDGRDGVARPQQAPPSNRPRPGDLTPALRAILDGTHSSLHEEDGPV